MRVKVPVAPFPQSCLNSKRSLQLPPPLPVSDEVVVVGTRLVVVEGGLVVVGGEIVVVSGGFVVVGGEMVVVGCGLVVVVDASVVVLGPFESPPHVLWFNPANRDWNPAL